MTLAPPPWISGGPNPVWLAGGQQALTATLIECSPLSRAGGTSASASSGTGGWQVTDKTRQQATTEWLDYYPFVQTLTLRLDDDVQGAGQTPIGMSILESFEIPQPGSYPPLPPIMQIGGPIHHTDLLWVCSRLSFDGGDDGQLRDDAGNLIMQMVTLELTEYVPSTAIVSALTPAQQAAQIGSTIPSGTAAGQTTIAASGNTYTVVAGDTLQSIAARVLGNVANWMQLALLNGLGNGAILTPGQVLQLPAS